VLNEGQKKKISWRVENSSGATNILRKKKIKLKNEISFSGKYLRRLLKTIIDQSSYGGDTISRIFCSFNSHSLSHTGNGHWIIHLYRNSQRSQPTWGWHCKSFDCSFHILTVKRITLTSFMPICTLALRTNCFPFSCSGFPKSTICRQLFCPLHPCSIPFACSSFGIDAIELARIYGARNPP